ncbi:MAG: stage 0 sporulation family protein [Candidatus Aadella gelida]|nr:stage 0 sporulation family protein [Candidatus Aadella gelida]
MHEIVQVQLRAAGEIKHFITSGMKLTTGDKVIVEADRGLEYGEVVSSNEEIKDVNSLPKPVRKVIRKANPWDEKQIEKNKNKTKDLIRVCMKKIEEHKLPMKLVDAEYSFDRSKIIFYFTSENRVDFRDLVKNLASIFRVRIELRQIGVRDEARMLGGHGPCGRSLCCMSFLKDFNPVTIKMAKTQNLPLNPTKISGLCGRLMCCLGYEYDHYKECSKNMPKVGRDVKTGQGEGKIIGVNPLNRTVTVDFGEGKIRDLKVCDIEGCGKEKGQDAKRSVKRGKKGQDEGRKTREDRK